MIDISKVKINVLLNRIAKGDDEAFKSLYIHYHLFVYQIVTIRIGDHYAAEELTNDVFMTICEKPLMYNSSSKFSTLLIGIAKNKIMDWWRKQNRQPLIQDVDDEVINLIPDDNKSILQVLEHNELDEVLRECIKQLPVNQRDAISIALFYDEKIETLSEMLDCPQGTVKTRLMHARLKIKTCVQSALGEIS